MTKSQLCVKQICLPSIISVLTNNKKELWKTVSLTSFRKPPNAICFNLLLQVCPSVLPSVFAVIYTSFVLYFEWLFLCFSQFGGSSLRLNSWHSSFKSSEMFKSLSTPHVSVCVWKWRFFPSGLAYRPPVSGNASFQITLQSRNFRKRRLLDSCGCRKNEYVAVLDPRSYPAHEMRRNAHAPIQEGTAFSKYCIFAWTGKNDSKTQREEKSGEKKSPLSNKNGYVWTGPKWVKKSNVHLFWQHTHLSSSSRWINFLSKLSTFNRWS